MQQTPAIYARQSIDKKDSLSIEGQIKECEYVLRGEKAVVFRDKGYSGKNTDRPALKRLIQEISLGHINKVVVYKLDRISRNITDFYKLYETMEKNGCEFVSASESFDTSNAMGKAMMGILAIFAQMERENIQKRVKDNYYYRTSHSGSWAGGPAPYGFKNGRTKEGKPTLIRIEEEVKAIECAFGLYYGVAHLSLGEIARYLNDNGYKPRKSKTFTSSTVSKILQNPVYVVADELLFSYFKKRKIKFLNSQENWDGTTSCHIIGKRVGNSNIRSYTSLKDQSVYLTNFEGFIPSQQYVGVQERLGENQQITRNNVNGALAELGGKLKCKECGYAVKSYSRSTNDRPYLDCYGNRTLHICEAKFNKVNFYALQEAVGVEIQKQLDSLHGVWLERLKVVEQTEMEIAKKKELRDKLLESFGESEIGTRAITDKVEKLQAEIDDLEYKHNLASRSTTTLQLFLEFNETLKDNVAMGVKYIDLHPYQKREIIDIMINKIYLTNDINDFEIEWKL